MKKTLMIACATMLLLSAEACKGRTTKDVEATGETVELDVTTIEEEGAALQAPDSISMTEPVADDAFPMLNQ